MDLLFDLVTNPYLLTALSSWGVAQVAKTILYAAINRKLDIRRLFGDGGMPSGHSATVASLAMLCALMHGTGSHEFAVTAILAIIVCHDATGVRQETGKQAVLINEMVDIIERMKTGHALSDIELKVFVGHTPLQVAAGIALGILNALVMYFFVFS